MGDFSLTPTRVVRLEALFDEALSRPESERESFISAHASDEPELLSELRALLVAHARSDGQLESPLRTRADQSAQRVGARLGAYEVGRLIGEGGMGAVHEAVRADDQYRQRVAVKFLRRSSASDHSVRRFRAERQILANLQHPNIASLIDGGVTPDGQPYFVMEYIDGEPITRWCDSRSLDVNARLALFRQVCAAVSAAHRKLVVHRDLKPGNILVTAEGTVKLLDFGIAKLLRDEGDTDEPMTQVGQRAYTPEYASPEQVRGLHVDTSTDVYSLGVVLFELLAGQRPFVLQGKHLAEVERIVCETPAPKPSSTLASNRWQQLGERSEARAQRSIAGDLDAIVLMALRKEPARRYASVDDLASDVARYLNGLPVSARPERIGYRVTKFIRRRKLETAATAIALLSLIGGTFAALRQARKAEAQSARATEVTRFLTTMLGSSNPESFGKDIKMREVLDSAVRRTDSLRATPELEAEVREIIGGTYLALGEHDKAQEQFIRDLAARRRAVPQGNYATAITLSKLSLVHESSGRYDVADSLLVEAEKLFKQYPHPGPIEEATALENRARVLGRAGNNKDAMPLLRQSLALHKKYYPNNDTASAPTFINAAVVTSDLGNHAEAESLSAAGLAAARRAYGDNHPLVASALSVRAGTLESLDRMDEAGEFYLAALETKRRLLGPEHPEYAVSMFNYADYLLRRERWSESAVYSRRVLALRGKTLDDTHPAIGVAMQYLGRALAHMDSMPEGEKWLRESIALRKKILPAGHWLISSGESVLGEHMAMSGKYEAAERLLLPAEKHLVEIRGEKTSVVRDVRKRIVALYQKWGKKDELARWQAKLDAVAP